MNIEGKTALVTGGASGLGEATIRTLFNHGGNVVILDLNQERGRALADELGERAMFIKMDVSKTEDIQAAIEQAVKKFGGVHILVNCAGIGIIMKTTDRKRGPADIALFKKTIDINLVGTFDMIRNAATAMLSNEPEGYDGRGVIINTASVAAFEGQIGQIAYTASKAAIVGMTITLARDLSAEGIRVNTIAPGTFDTPMLASLPDNVKESLGKAVPFPSRLGRPEEFGMLVRQIVENPMLNGETIRLDGAIRMQPR